jgi:hypothetical protein
MRLAFILLSWFLVCCSTPTRTSPKPITQQADTQTPPAATPAPVLPKVEDPVPYPEATAPSSFPAVASGPDSDCSGLIELPPGRPRVGTWAIGELLGSRFTPMLFFNTKKAAKDCAGSSGMLVRRLTRDGWKE